MSELDTLRPVVSGRQAVIGLVVGHADGAEHIFANLTLWMTNCKAGDILLEYILVIEQVPTDCEKQGA